jgi:putative flippase GtrA
MTEHHDHTTHAATEAHAGATDGAPDHEHAAHDHHGHGHAGHGHREQSLNRLSVQAVIHCMTGCAIGEILGMVIATSLGWGNLASIALSVGLAFVFGYGLTSIPLFKAGLALAVVVPLALATDTASIAVMELVDNLTVVLIPSAMDAHLGDVLFWASMIGGFVVAFPFAFVVNRWLLQRGKGHALVHAYHQH